MCFFNMDINLYFLLNILKLNIYSYGICVSDLIFGIMLVFLIISVNDLEFFLKLWIFFKNLDIDCIIEFGDDICD